MNAMPMPKPAVVWQTRGEVLPEILDRAYGCAYAPFLPNFNGLLFGWTL